MDTPKIALAPSLDLLGVPSNSIKNWSSPFWSNSLSIIFFAISSFTLETALLTLSPA
jgi:hypothetical protein